MKIVNYPHPALRAKGRAVERIDKEIVMAAGQMLDLMYENEGLGLAAQQVALDYQLTVINFEGDPEKKDQEVVAINPVIVDQSGNVKGREGCLSFPGLYQEIRRAKTVTVRYYNLESQLVEMTCSDLSARVWQHEIDHLHGQLYIDKMGPLARLGSKKALDEFLSEFEEQRKKGQIPADMEPVL